MPICAQQHRVRTGLYSCKGVCLLPRMPKSLRNFHLSINSEKKDSESEDQDKYRLYIWCFAITTLLIPLVHKISINAITLLKILLQTNTSILGRGAVIHDVSHQAKVDLSLIHPLSPVWMTVCSSLAQHKLIAATFSLVCITNLILVCLVRSLTKHNVQLKLFTANDDASETMILGSELQRAPSSLQQFMCASLVLTCLVGIIVALLLVMSGDVEWNPGPVTGDYGINITAVLNEDTHLMPIKEAIWEARSQWKDIGRKLGLNNSKIRAIHESTDGECLHEVLTEWIETGKATINDLLKALESKIIGRPDIAEEIRSLEGPVRAEVGLDSCDSTKDEPLTVNTLQMRESLSQDSFKTTGSCLRQDNQPDSDNLQSTTEGPSVAKKPRLAIDNDSLSHAHARPACSQSNDQLKSSRSGAPPQTKKPKLDRRLSSSSSLDISEGESEPPAYATTLSNLQSLSNLGQDSDDFYCQSSDHQTATGCDSTPASKESSDDSLNSAHTVEELSYSECPMQRLISTTLSSDMSNNDHSNSSTGNTAEPSSDSQSQLFPREPSQLITNDLHIVYEAVYPAHPNWYNFGLALDIPAFTLDSIRDVYREVSSKCLRETLLTRLRKQRLTWCTIITVLKKPTVGENELARRLERKYFPHRFSTSTGDMTLEEMRSALSGEPTVEELCALPVKDVWYPLGLWLGVEESKLRDMKGQSRQKSVEALFTLFQKFPVRSPAYSKFMDKLPNEKHKQARELIIKKDTIQFRDFIQDLPEEHIALALELIEMMSSKNTLLVRALVKVGKRKIAETICSKQGVSLTGYLDATDPASNLPDCVLRYASYLKDRYRQMSVLPDPDWPPAVASKNHYTNLALIGKERDDFLKEGDVKEVANDYAYGKIDKIVASKEDIQLEEAFYPMINPKNNKSRLTILMDGAPGVGKTTISRKLCIDWAEGAILQEYQLVILVPLREMRVTHSQHQTIADLLPADDLQLKVQVTMYVKQTSGAGVLIIFDGFDELSSKQRKMWQDSLFLDIIKGSTLHQCSVLVTSRPYASGPLRGLNRVNRHVEILGFTKKQITDCVCTNLPDQKGKQLILKLDQRLDIRSLCYIPLNCRIVVFVYERENFKLPATLTELYKVFILHTIKHYAPKITSNCLVRERIEKTRNVDLLPDPVLLPLNNLSEFAFSGMKEDNLVFDSDELKASHDYLCLGLMTSLHCLSISGELEYFQFLHLTIQEFLAARHIASDAMSTNEKRQFLQTNIGNERFRMTCLFLAGLTNFNFLLPNEPLLEDQTSYLSGDDQKEKLLFLAQLIFESKSSSIRILTTLNSRLDMSGHQLSKFDSLVLAYFLSATPEDHVWEVINLARCGLTGYSILFGQKCSANSKVPAIVMTKKLLLACDETKGRNAHVSITAVSSLISASNESPMEELLLPKLAIEKESSRECKRAKFFRALANHQNLKTVQFLSDFNIVRSEKKLQVNGMKTCSNCLQLLLKCVATEKVQEIHLSNRPEAFEDCFKCGSYGRDAVQSLCEVLSRSKYIQTVNLHGCQLSDEAAVSVIVSLSDKKSRVYVIMEESKVTPSGLRNIQDNLSSNVHCSVLGMELYVDENMLLRLYLYYRPSNQLRRNLEDAHNPTFLTSFIENIPSRFTGLGVDITYISEELVLSLIQASKHIKYLKLNKLDLVITDTSIASNLQRLFSHVSPNQLHFSNCTLSRQTAANAPEVTSVVQAVQIMLATNKSLEVFTLRHCEIHDVVISHFAAGLAHNTTLLQLDVSYNHSITNHGWVELFNALKLGSASLQKLDISKNELNVESTIALNEMLCRHKTLTTLSLSECSVNDHSLNTFLSGLSQNLILKEIVISKNKGITCKGWVRFFRTLQSTSVSMLDVTYNKFGDEGLSALRKFLHHNKTITDFRAGHCDLTDDLLREIADSLSHNSLTEQNVSH